MNAITFVLRFITSSTTWCTLMLQYWLHGLLRARAEWWVHSRTCSWAGNNTATNLVEEMAWIRFRRSFQCLLNIWLDCDWFPRDPYVVLWCARVWTLIHSVLLQGVLFRNFLLLLPQCLFVVDCSRTLLGWWSRRCSHPCFGRTPCWNSERLYEFHDRWGLTGEWMIVAR